MDYIVISGVKPYDGRYELDLGVDLTTREWGWIKRLAGYLPVTMDDNSFSDPELACVLAAIVMKRAGRIQVAEVPGVFERLADAPFGSAITIETEEQPVADDAGPPSPSSSGSSNGSGESSRTSSETSEPSPAASGTPGSATSASAPATLVS